jgi:hypothetical protein
MAPARSFPFRYGLFRPFLSVVGAGPAASSITLDDEALHVRMGWSFQAEIPRRSITGARPFTGIVGGIGVHGWRGRWLVNGAASGVVRIDIDPPAPGRVLGVPVRLRELAVSVESPDALIDALVNGGVEDDGQQH